MRSNILMLLLLLAAPAWAVEENAAPPPALEPVPDEAPLPGPPAESPAEAAELEPEVTIIERKTETIEEYRINGQLYMVKVTPRKGYPYYLVDSDGDGRLDTRENELDPKIVVPRWMIFRWK